MPTVGSAESVDTTDDAAAYNELAQASIPEMMDVCCRDMVLRDRNKLVYPHWVGSFNTLTNGLAATGDGPGVAWSDGATALAAANRYYAGEDLTNTSAAPNAYTTGAQGGITPSILYHQLGIAQGNAWAPTTRGASPGVGYDQFKALFAPLQGYKYDPFKMRLKFQIIRKRTYYNTSNVLQTVHHYLLSRKRHQVYGYNLTDDSKVTPASESIRQCMGDAWQTLDVLPYRDLGRMQYNAAQGDQAAAATGYYRPQSAAVFFVDGKTSAEDAVLQITQAGEVYKKFAHYRHMGMSTQWLRAIYMRPPGLPGTVDFYPNKAHDQSFFGQATLSGMYPWDSIGDHQQNALPSNAIKWGQSQYQQTDAIGPILDSEPDIIDWTLNPTFTPLKNPFLKRLFRIHEKRMVLPPGGTQTVTHRTRSKRGGINLWHSGSIRDVRFFYAPDVDGVSPYGSKVAPSHLEWMNAVFPYRNPYAHDWKPPATVYATKRRNGFQTSDLWVTVRGQMAYSTDGGSPPALSLNYAPGTVVYRERTIIKCKVVSYGRQMVTGGKSFYLNELAPSTTLASYHATNPTVQPTAPAFSVIPPAVA